MDDSKPVKQRRGFACLSADERFAISSKGGLAAQRKGTAHQWTPDEARAQGKRGGTISRGGRGRLVE